VPSITAVAAASGVLSPSTRTTNGSSLPRDLPTRWREKQRDLNLATPLNLVATLDIVGVNSGSPVVDRNGELVGVIFDGNLEGLGGRYVYTDRNARAVAVDGRAIIEALTKVYGAAPLAAELTEQ
jgi:hypothetical protein